MWGSIIKVAQGRRWSGLYILKKYSTFAPQLGERAES